LRPTLLWCNPLFVVVGWPALLPVGVALNFACYAGDPADAKHTDPISSVGGNGRRF